MRDEPRDAIVVGAGPAGTSAAYHLASRGRRVLLIEQRHIPRPKACGDGLSSGAVRLLSEMGVVDDLPPHRATRGLRVHMRNRGSRTFSYADHPGSGHGAVIDRTHLDAALCHRAGAAGAELWTRARVQRLLNSADGVCGVEVAHHGTVHRIPAYVVIAADGADTAIGRQAGLCTEAAAGFGYQTYVGDITGLDDYLEIHLPLFDVTDRYLLPSYGWVFPTGPTTANIGIGLFDHSAEDPSALLDRFLDTLRQNSPGFAHAQQLQKPRGAPVRFDFDATRCGAPGLVLVGDAAGMVSPFTGEGVGFALESGKLAAEHIDTALRAGRTHAPAPYIAALSARYGSYSEAGTQSMRRYLLAWHVLESTFDDDRPLFDLCRRATLLPESLRAETLFDRLPPLPATVARSLRRDLLPIAEVVIGTVRENWPMFARILATDTESSAAVLRPAVLLLLTSYVGGERHDLTTALAAAVELGFAAGMAINAAADEEPPSGCDSRVPWGNRFAIMLGDFLLSRSYELSALGGPDVIAAFADATGAACEGQIRELRSVGVTRIDEAEHIDVITQTMTTAFELPCRLGARLGGAPSATAAALTEYGRHLGVAYALIDEVKRTRTTAPQTADDRLSAIATTYARRACRQLDDVPPSPARDVLAELALHVVA